MTYISLFELTLPSWKLFFGRAGGYHAVFGLKILGIGGGFWGGALIDFDYSPARGLYLGSILFVPICRTLFRGEQ